MQTNMIEEKMFSRYKILIEKKNVMFIENIFKAQHFKSFRLKQRKVFSSGFIWKCWQQTVYPDIYLESKFQAKFREKFLEILFYDYFRDKVHFLSVHKFSPLMLSHKRYEVDKRHAGCLAKLNIYKRNVGWKWMRMP